MKRLLTGIFAAALLAFSNQPAAAGAFYDDPTPAKTAAPATSASPEKKESPVVETKATEPLKPAPQPESAPEKPQTITGMVSRVIDTATFEMRPEGAAGSSRKLKKITLFGIEKATGGQIVGDMALLIGMKGSRLTCAASEPGTFRCTDAAGDDIGKEALKRGIARALPSAPPEYKEAEGEAMKAKTGIWR